MTLECPKCSARYNIQESLIPAQGARVKCKKCATVITIPPPVVELAPQDLELIPPPGPAPSANARAPRSPPPEEPAPFERGFGEKAEPAAATSMDSGIVVDRPFEGTANLPPADPEFERASAP